MATITLLANAQEDRSATILASLRPVFAEKGFDGASMQDLAKAAGMSVGNFYRYFPSKAAIVEAMVGMDLREIERDFAAIQGFADPMDGLRQTIAAHVRKDDCIEDGQLWAEITAASLRKPEIGAAACRMEAEVVQQLTGVFARATGRSVGDAGLRYAAHSGLIVLLVKGAAMCRAEHRSEALISIILKTIDRTLDDISADTAKG